MIDRLPVTLGFQELLATLTQHPVGLRTIPLDDDGNPVQPPYTLLDPMDRLDDDGTLADDGKAIVVRYQATFVSGPTPGVPESRSGEEQVQWMADRAWKVTERPADQSTGYAHPLNAGPGVACWRREATEGGGTSDPNDAIMTSVIRYRLYLEKTA